jgi:hypothetical protein
MPDPTPASWADPFRLEPATAASLADALAATPAARSGPRWDSCPTPAPIRQQLRRMVAAQLLAAVLAYRPQPRAWPRPRPAYLPHPRRRLPRVRGVVRVRSKPWPAWVA